MAHLERQGYQIVARNWRCKLGELDIIASQGPDLVFVEVRTRRGRVFGSPEESITPLKQRRLTRLAQTYLQFRETSNTPWSGPWRIDVIAVKLDSQGAGTINHLKHAIEGEH